MSECVCIVLNNKGSIFNISNCFDFVNNLEEECVLYIYPYQQELINNLQNLCNSISKYYPKVKYIITRDLNNNPRKYAYLLSKDDFFSVKNSASFFQSFANVLCPDSLLINKKCLESTSYMNGENQEDLFQVMIQKTEAKAIIKTENSENINILEYSGNKTLDVELMVNGKLTPVRWIGKRCRNYSNNTTNNDSIVLIQQFFIHPNKDRQNEIEYCIKKNIENPHINEIILLNEEIYKTAILNHKKIKQVNLQRRLKFSDILRYIKYELNNSNVIFSNSDMFFDDTLSQIKYADFSTNKSIDTVCRFEFNKNLTLDECVLRDNPRFHSQDAWIVHSSHIKNIDTRTIKERFSFELGKPACDQKIIAEFDKLNFEIYSNPDKIKGYHYHTTAIRDYDPKNMLPTPYGYVLPTLDNRTKNNDFMKESNLFWQYPVITEKTFFEQNWRDNEYLPIPWATIYDKYRDKIQNLYPIIRKHYNKNNYYTCCQTIHLDKLVPLLKACCVSKIYTPHKCIDIDKLDYIELKPCPLYAVNVEDNQRNKEFNNIDLTNRETKYLYSFKGAWEPHYISNIRQDIFKIKHPDDTIIENIGKWHFLNDVYTNIQSSDGKVEETKNKKDRTSEYNQLLLDSKFSLCPSGAGPNSIRFWESLAVGCIPVLLADTLELPVHKDWDKAILRVSEKNVINLEFLRDITDDEIVERRNKCIEIYDYFKNNYRNTNILECKTITIEIPDNLLKSHFKCFGHFITDHLFMLFKFKTYLASKNISINKLNIICCPDDIPKFMIQLYNIIFENVIFNGVLDNTIDLKVVLGSIKSSENKLIFLSKSDYNKIIPKVLYENVRKISINNSKYATQFRDFIINKLGIKTDFYKKDVLIVTRKNNKSNSKGRQWDNITILLDYLNKKNLSHDTMSIEDYSIKEQIQLVNSYRYIVTASNSSFLGHYFWINEKVTILECCIKGMRCVNTVIYAKNLNLNLYQVTSKLNYNKTNNYNHKLKEILEFQFNNDYLINSQDVNSSTLINETDFYENCLNYMAYYNRITTENINISDIIDKIEYIINNV